MCDVNAYIRKDGKEELYLENVNIARSEEGNIFLKNLFGEQKIYKGVIREFSLPGHRLVLEEK
jgi:predicted RNA-binding protein